MITKKICAIVFIVGILVGFIGGYSVGFSSAISWGLKKAGNFVSVEVDMGELKDAIILYQHNIDKHFPDVEYALRCNN